ncbi:pyridoxamine 5'-phosphate oxidase family protein [Natronolimnohabitans innermongolicus]|uniref:Flavin-nucleotide-binding protein-like protein n=1 Tax=Natronolimnohabitans innermongolicus JCM 12255 TaxID=1227499 RepID=L9XAG5_9EURY|nr:pyridoxamine 5'-phosphate oxidase family protein [Natronolimnohabitans innermongolicus]ELY58710.1 flavin-nucleotide-binding protein-like protein [Natronolimnohabitans innermongolicus JCM 12255]
MTGLRWVQLPSDERAEFLGDGGIGVLSFGTDEAEPPASLPVSYGYLDEPEHFYFKLSFPPGSSKSELVGNPASFVVHGERDGTWHSVVASGTLEELANLPPESAAVQRMWAVSIPTVDIFDRPREEIPFHDFRLVPDSITGRKALE